MLLKIIRLVSNNKLEIPPLSRVWSRYFSGGGRGVRGERGERGRERERERERERGEVGTGSFPETAAGVIEPSQ